MKRELKRIIGLTAFVLFFFLSIPVAFSFAYALVQIDRFVDPPNEAVREGSELSTRHIALLNDLGVIGEDEEVLWLVSSAWPDYVEMVITSRRVARYWRTTDRFIERSSIPSERTIPHEGLLYGVKSHDLETIVGVKTHLSGGESDNKMVLRLDDGSKRDFFVGDTDEEHVTKMRADIVEGANALRDR